MQNKERIENEKFQDDRMIISVSVIAIIFLITYIANFGTTILAEIWAKLYIVGTLLLITIMLGIITIFFKIGYLKGENPLSPYDIAHDFTFIVFILSIMSLLSFFFDIRIVSPLMIIAGIVIFWYDFMRKKRNKELI